MEKGEQVHLLLNAPGQPPLNLPPSPWRAWHTTDRGPVDPVRSAASARLSPVAPRAERALVAAVAADDVDALHRIAAQGGPAQEAAQVLAAIRMASVDPSSAVDALVHLATVPADVTEGKILRRHWSSLAIQVALAPGVPALVGLGRSAFALLAVDLLVEQGRVAEAIALLDTLPPRPAVVLALAATLLANGDHQRVLDVTATLPNVDDTTALAYVARSVAARSLHDVQTALDAVCEALSAASQNGAVIAAGLEERAHLYSLAGEAQAAHADLEALTALAAGQSDVTVPRPSLLRRGEDLPEEDGLDRARNRLRRRITGVGKPGTFGGRHHSTYRDEIATMFSLGRVEAVEDLLLGLLDAVEDEVDELALPLDATFFLTLADLYQDSGRTEDLHALRERYAAADARSRRAAEVADLADLADDEPAGGGAVAPASAPVDLVKEAPASPALGGAAPAPARVPAAASAAVVVADPVPAVHVEPAAVERLEGAGVMPSVEPEPPEVPVDVAEAVEPTESEGADEVAVDLAEPAADEPPVERQPTAVERAVRGPRVRSL